MDLSKTLKYYRKMSGLTQQQISIAIGKERSCYAKYESGAANPTLETLEKLADLFNVPLISIINNTLTAPKSDENKSKVFSAKSYDEQELLMIYRQMSDNEKNNLLDRLKKDFFR